MSEPVGGKSGWTPAVGSGYKCGSASPVRYLISVTSAARRFQRGALNFSNPDTNAARRSEPDRNRDRNRMGTGSEPDLGYQCGSASPVCDRISDISAARRLLLVIGSRISVRLGVSCL